MRERERMHENIGNKEERKIELKINMPRKEEIGQLKGWEGREKKKNQRGRKTNCMCIRFVRMFESKKNI